MIGLRRDDQLIVPDDFLNRERYIACGFKLGQLLDRLLVVIHNGKTAETHQGGLAGQRKQGFTRAEAAFGEHLTQKSRDNVHTGAFGKLLFVLTVREKG